MANSLVNITLLSGVVQAVNPFQVERLTEEQGATRVYLTNGQVLRTATPRAALQVALEGAMSGGDGGKKLVWEWNGTDLAQFDEVWAEAGVTHALSVGADPSGAPMIEMTSGGATGYRFWAIQDLDLLTAFPHGRFAVECDMGPRTAAIIPYVVPIFQHSTRWIGVQRQAAAADSRLAFYCRNNSATPTIWTPGVLGTIGDAQAWGNRFELRSYVRWPVVSPATAMRHRMQMRAPGGIGADGDGPTWSTTLDFNAAWQGGGDIHACIGIYGTSTVNTSYLRNLRIYELVNDPP